MQSNASDNPTLIIPLCARVVEDGVEKSDLNCESPVRVAPGQKLEDLCR